MKLFGHELVIWKPKQEAAIELKPLPDPSEKEVEKLKMLLAAVDQQANKKDVKKTGFIMKRKKNIGAKAGISAHAIIDNIGISGNADNDEEVTFYVEKDKGN